MTIALVCVALYFKYYIKFIFISFNFQCMIQIDKKYFLTEFLWHYVLRVFLDNCILRQGGV